MKKLLFLLVMLIGMIGIQAQVAITQSGNSVKFVNTPNATTTYLTGIDIVNINSNTITFQRSGGSSESGYVRVNFTDIVDKMGMSTPALYVDNLLTLGYFDPGVVVTNLIVDLSVETGTGGAYLKIETSSGVKDSVKLAESGSIDVARTDANTMTLTVPVVDTSLFVRLGGRTGGQTIAQKVTFSFDSTIVFNSAYNATTWNNSNAVPTKNALRDQLVLLAPIAGPTFTGTVNGGDSTLVPTRVYSATTWNNSTGVPTMDALRDHLVLLAPLASPVFTGTISGGDSTLVTTRAFNTATWNNSTATPTMDAVRDEMILKATINKPTFTDSAMTADEAYNATTWNNAMSIPTKNALRDQIILLATLSSPSFTGTVTGGDSVLVGKDAFNATTWNNGAGAVSKDAARDEFILKANLAGPTFTGTVGGGDSVLVVNEAFNGTTWNNANAAPTKNAVRDEMILKATVASPVFTGTVSGGDSTLVTTRAFNTATWNNSTAVPTMDAVRDELILKSAIGDAETITGVKKFTGHNLYYGEVTTVTDTTALAVATHYTVLADATSSAILMTLPDAATCEGAIIRIKCINADAEVKIVTAGGTIDATAGATGITMAVWDGKEFMSNGTNWYIISKF
jgi:hypothetical protein